MIYQKFTDEFDKIPFEKGKSSEYNNKTQDVTNRFTEALYVEYGVEKNDKRHRAFSLAWEQGHSFGYSEVENYFMDLVELIEK